MSDKLIEFWENYKPFLPWVIIAELIYYIVNH